MKPLLLLLVFPLLFGFKFNPMSQAIELDSGKKSVQFIAENETTESMAIEFSVKERQMDETGEEKLPAAKELSIFPPQVIIPPKEKRTIRVNYNGPKDISSELAYRVIAEQLPLNVKGKKQSSGIQMLMRYMAALYVTPKDVAPELQASLISSRDGRLKLLVKNTGKKHQILIKPTLIAKKGEKKWVLKEKDLPGVAGENVLAGSQRLFTLGPDERIPADAEATLKVEE